MRLRVAGRHRVHIPSVDERYHFEPGREYWMSPTALHNMLRVLERRARNRDDYWHVMGQLLIDKPGQWEIGGFYVLRGRGVMKLVGVHQPEPDRTTLNFHTTGLLNYWADADEVLRQADAELIKLFADGERRAGFEKHAEQLEAWCKEIP
jgi:hypothetical protein